MIFLEQSKLSYIGTRLYIRGVDLYTYFINGLGAVQLDMPKPAMITAFKLLREIKSDGHWHILEKNKVLPEDNDISASLDYVDQSGVPHEAVFIEDGAPIMGRKPDIPSCLLRIEPRNAFGGDVELKPLVNQSSFMDALIEANKAFHIATLKDRREPVDSIRFVYLEDMPSDLPPSQSFIFENRGEHKKDGRTYTLSSIRPAETSTTAAPLIKICYCY